MNWVWWSFVIIHWEKVVISDISVFRTNFIHNSTGNHFFCKFLCISIYALVINIHGNHHFTLKQFDFLYTQ